MQPGDIEVTTPAVGVVHQHDRPEIAVAQRNTPRQRLVQAARRITNLLDFRLADCGLIARIVAKPEIPDHRPNHAENPEGPERGAPTVGDLNRNDKQGRDHPADPARHPHYAVSASALDGGEPARDGTGTVGVRAGLADTERKACREQRGKTGDGSSKRGERRPPDNNSSEHFARTDTVSQRAGRYLEERIRERERAHHPAPHLRGNVQVFLHARASHRDANPVEIGDDREQKQHAEDTVAIAHIFDIVSHCGAGHVELTVLEFGVINAERGACRAHRWTA